MARHYSGFLALNTLAKEEWALIEACETNARVKGKTPSLRDFEAERSRAEKQVAALLEFLDKEHGGN